MSHASALPSASQQADAARPAAPWRALVFLFDLVVVWFAAWLISLPIEESFFINGTLYLLYRSVLSATWHGGTVGRALFGQKVRVAHDNTAPGIGRLLVRELPVALIIFTVALAFALLDGAHGIILGLFAAFDVWPLLLVVEFAFVLTRLDRRSLRDLMAGTEVVVVR